jgi:DNA-binding MarR family transcriptional regulator
MVDQVSSEYPMGLFLTFGAKYYYGALTHALQQRKIDRYFSILLLLGKCKLPLNQQDIGQAMQVDKVSMVRILDQLERSDLIQRTVNPNDRREKWVVLSEKGKEEVQHIQRAVNKINRALFKGLDPVEIDMFNRVLDHMLTQLKSMPSSKVMVKYTTSASADKEDAEL